MKRLPTLVWRCTLTLAALVVASAGCEDLVIRYRLAHSPGSALFEQVAIYEAGEVKGGKIEYYMDQPQMQVCVHAIFPHFGNAPCWYVKRHTTKVLSRGASPRLPAVAAGARGTQGGRRPKEQRAGTWSRIPKVRQGDAATMPQTGFRAPAARSWT